jgi:hypothetical protein
MNTTIRNIGAAGSEQRALAVREFFNSERAKNDLGPVTWMDEDDFDEAERCLVRGIKMTFEDA